MRCGPPQFHSKEVILNLGNLLQEPLGTLKDVEDSPVVVYEGVSGERAPIGAQSSHTAVCIQTQRKVMMMIIDRGLDVDDFTQEVNRWRSLAAPVIWERKTPKDLHAVKSSHVKRITLFANDDIKEQIYSDNLMRALLFLIFLKEVLHLAFVTRGTGCKNIQYRTWTHHGLYFHIFQIGRVGRLFIDQTGTNSLVMSLRWKSRSRCLDWMEIWGLQVGFRARLLTVYLLQGGGTSIEISSISIPETSRKTNNL